MIDDPPLLRVSRGFARPTAAQLDRLRDAPTGWICDAQGGRAALGFGVRPILAERPRCFGTALTCWCGPNDNLAIMAAIALARPGDVIVAATEDFTGAGHVGDLLAGMMRNKGVAGFVTDGCVRDIEGLREAGLPVFAAGVTPDSCVKSGPGTVGLPIVLGKRRIASGDIVIADADGVATVPFAEIDAVIEALAGVAAAEAALLARVRDGLAVPDGIEALLASARVRQVD